MSTDEYVPSDEDMEDRYVLWSLSLMDASPGDREAWAEKLRAEFGRGLARVRRDAYDEGYERGMSDHCDAPQPCDGPQAAESNPYLQETDR